MAKKRVFSKGEDIPEYVIKIRNRNDAYAIYKFGCDCEIIIYKNKIKIFPLKYLQEDEVVIYLKKCVGEKGRLIEIYNRPRRKVRKKKLCIRNDRAIGFIKIN